MYTQLIKENNAKNFTLIINIGVKFLSVVNITILYMISAYTTEIIYNMFLKDGN
jgi:hypothetical protein